MGEGKACRDLLWGRKSCGNLGVGEKGLVGPRWKDGGDRQGSAAVSLWSVVRANDHGGAAVAISSVLCHK